MKKLVVFAALLLSIVATGQVNSFKLSNGLTVIINEDNRTPSVFGCLVVKAGSVDEPEDATGLAHYLEHMMFKGSENVGTTDWSKEQVHYNKIIDLYDELQLAPIEEREAIQKKINQESLLAGNYTINNEFSNLIQAIGGTSLNAATSYDMTYYFNSFPSYQLERWLELQADRFANPVFRGFQAELETVYEEKNMYSDNPFQVLMEEFTQDVFGEGNPYSRPIIGITEHLKTPSMSKLINFYNTYYVPSNMALILSGDIDAEEARSIIDATVGKWQSKGEIDRISIKEPSIAENITIKKKLTPMPILMLGYKGKPSSSDDKYALSILSSLLTNRNKTGKLDKLVLDGDVQDVSFSAASFRQSGYVSLLGVPVFDKSQRVYTSLSRVETHFKDVLKDVMNGNVEDWLIQSVKNDFLVSYELNKESNYSYGMMIARAFGNDESLEDFENYPERIQAVTKDDIVTLAKELFDAPYISFQSQLGEPKKDKISKPEYKPIEPAKGERSAFAKEWLEKEVNVNPFKPIDFSKDLSMAELAPGVDLFYAENSHNDIFSLTIIYGVGSNKIPELDFSINLMNRAGIMALYTPYELKKEFSNLGCMASFGNDKYNTYVTLMGKEENLAQACQLLSKSYLLPSLDEKQLNSLIGNELGQRYFERKDKDSQSNALREYLRYGDKSQYLNRLTNEEIFALTVSDLAGGFIKATQYETSVHYTGRTSFDKVQNILTNNLAFPSSLKPSVAHDRTPSVTYDETTVFVYNNKDVRQSDIYLYIPGEDYEISQKPLIDGFNQYFGGGFNGLVLQELRELRSFAYTASAYYSIPPVQNKKSMFTGYIGTQNDKALDAINEFVKLINNMPEHPERISNIKNYLEQSTVNVTPSIRQRTMIVEEWMDYGYEKDPRIELIEKYNNLEFNDILEFYNSYIKGKNIGIAIISNSKEIDKKELKTIGKVKKVDSSKIFKY